MGLKHLDSIIAYSSFTPNHTNVFHFDHGKYLAFALHEGNNAQASLRCFLLNKLLKVF